MFPNAACLNNSPKRAGRASLAWLLSGTVLTVAMLAFPVAGIGQEGRGGMTADFTLSQSLSWSDNVELSAADADSSLRSVTALGFALTSETRSSKFKLAARSGWQAVLSGPGKSKRIDPSLSVDYSTESRNQALSLGFALSTADVGGDISKPNDGGVSDNELVRRTGSRTTLGANAGWEFGREAPFGGSLGYSFSKRSYNGVEDAGFFDDRSQSLSANLRFDVTPRVTLTTGARVSRYERDNDNDMHRRSASLSLGANLKISAIDRLSLSISQDRTETERLSGDTTTEGLSYGAEFTRTRPRGEIGVYASSRSSVAGRRVQFGLRHKMELKGGELSYDVGMIQFGDQDPRPTANLSYRYDMRSGVINVGLAQTPGVTADDEATLTTTLTGGVTYEVNSVSSLAANFSLTDRTVLGGEDDDQRRVQAGLSYRHDLTRDWDVRGAYTHTRITETGEPNRRSNALSVSVERGFSFRP